MLDAFRKWMFGRVPAPRYGGVYVPTVLPGDPVNMAAQAATTAAVAMEASRPTYNLNYKHERPVRRPQQTGALKRKQADDKARDRRRQDDSTSSALASSLVTDMAISSAFDTSSSWSSSDSSSSWSSDSSSSGSDFSGGGGSFGGGGADGSW